MELAFVSGGAQYDGLVGSLQCGPGGGGGPGPGWGPPGTSLMYGREGAGRPVAREPVEAVNSATT
ncbi:hypothetical protein GCM10010347_42620 [Streptomyces cirratus]|uniref:Uncharacterized protein n=1 Tax=Streptomyces cirratus TaxID=68187 RepID=A0ABQ3EY86_9ACTN|nr:hypothetical protein GCM10010347_42620 [Streptomyces cirratus]